MRTRPGITCALAALGLLVTAPALRAQPTQAPPRKRATPTETPWSKGVSAAARSRALHLFRQGNALFERSRYAEALARYRRAVKTWDHPTIRYNMAVSQVHLERPLEAYNHLKRALRFGRAPFGSQIFSQALTYLKLLKGRLAFVRVECEQPGVRVTLDGKELFVAPGSKRLVILPGRHALVASREGYLTQSRSPFLIPGKQTVLRVTLVPVSQAITMKRRWKRWWPWATFGAGALVAAVGVPLLLQARADLNDYDAEVKAVCPLGCQPGQLGASVTSLEDRSRRENVAAFVMFGVGGAALVTGIALVIMNQPRAVRTRARERPRALILPTPGGLSAIVSF